MSWGVRPSVPLEINLLGAQTQSVNRVDIRMWIYESKIEIEIEIEIEVEVEIELSQFFLFFFIGGACPPQ